MTTKLEFLTMSASHDFEGAAIRVWLTLNDEQLEALRRMLPAAPVTHDRTQVISDAVAAALRDEIRTRLEAEVSRDLAALKRDIQEDRANRLEAQLDQALSDFMCLYLAVAPDKFSITPQALNDEINDLWNKMRERLLAQHQPAALKPMPFRLDVEDTRIRAWRLELERK